MRKGLITMPKQGTGKQVSVLEAIMLRKTCPDLVMEPCHSSKCKLCIPDCQAKDGLGHMMGNPEVAMCYLKRKQVEIQDSPATRP